MPARGSQGLVGAALLSVFVSVVGGCSGRDRSGDSRSAPSHDIVCLANADCPPGEVCSAFLDSCLPNCEDPSRTCLAPLQCAVDQTGYYCDDPRPAPSCVGTPVGQAVPFVPSSDIHPSSSPVLHWVIADGCVPVTYESSLASERTALAAAVGAWNSVDCARLCLQGPLESDTRPDFLRGEHGIHVLAPFHPDTLPQLDAGAVGVTTLTFEVLSGRMLGAWIEVPPRAGLSTAEFIALVGYALGLKRPPASVDSALLSGPGSAMTMPTALDREAYCVLYGDPPYCAE